MISLSWYDLFFEKSGGPTVRVGFRILEKLGRPFLMLPVEPDSAMRALSLYSPQSPQARLARYLLKKAIGWHLPLPLKRKTLEVCPSSPFVQFILKLTRPSPSDFPDVALLAGNPQAKGQRYILLVFSKDQRPHDVVKFGMSEEARALIETEWRFLESLPPATLGIPVVRGTFHSGNADAFAMEFAEGNSPAYDANKIGAILTSWIQEDRIISPHALPAWNSVTTACPGNPLVQDLEQSLVGRSIHPVICHGDFAPWNIKEHPETGAWRVLDWERGQRFGFPAWDWFHFVIQTGILIDHLDPASLIARIRDLFRAPAFKAYAGRANIKGLEVHLLLGYLLHCKHVIKPTEGLKQIESLLSAFLVEHQLSGSGGLGRLVTSTLGPTFSIVTPSYKQLQWLELCAASVADQKGVRFEHIIQDAGSGPDLEAWAGQQKKAEVFIEPDAGMYDAINRGFRRARGQVVAWLNCDEQYLPGALAKVARFFTDHPDVDVLFGDALLIDEEGSILSYRRAVLPTLMHTRISHLGTLSCATFVRRSVLERGLFLKPEWKAIADAVWVADLLKANLRMAVLNEPLAAFTITKTNLGQTSLAHTESKRWQEGAPRWARALKFWFVFAYRLRKFLAGAYKLREVTTLLYTLSSPENRLPVSSSRLGFGWSQEKGRDWTASFRSHLSEIIPLQKRGSDMFSGGEQAGKPPSMIQTLAWCLIFISLILFLDYWTEQIVVTPFFCTAAILILGFYLKPDRLALVCLYFAVGVVCSLFFMQPHAIETRADYLNMVLRCGGFALASIMAILFSTYRDRSESLLNQTISILQQMPAPVVVSDAAGYIVFVNQNAVAYCEARKEDLISRRYVAIFMADLDEGTAMRRYREIFESEMSTTEKLTIKFVSGNRPGQLARHVCIGTLDNRLLVTLLEGNASRIPG